MLARIGALTAAVATLVACGALLGVDEDAPSGPGTDSTSSADGGDGAGADASGETPTYHDLRDVKRWETVRLDDIGWAIWPRGGAFDARYIYLTPHTKGVDAKSTVARFDPAGALGEKASWSFFDTAAVGGHADMRGAAFDGRYVYFPSVWGPWSRFDPQGDFTATGAWKAFDTSTVTAEGVGFHGLVFDGQYVYGVSFTNVTGNPGGRTVVRYDTRAPFGENTSWPAHLVPTEADTHHGGVFDGRHVYFIPHFGGPLLRYDNGQPFDDDRAWETVTIDPGGQTFAGAVYDGRMLYFVPAFSSNANRAGAVGRVFRYDTQQPFATPSFTSFDVGKLDPNAAGFAHGTFDGRFVYFAPHSRTANDAGAGHSLLVRYDTTSAFDLPASWQTFDLTTVDPRATNFMGALFDGRFVYLLPARDGVLARFDARSPTALPNRWGASFL